MENGLSSSERLNINIEENENGRKLRYSILDSLIEVVKTGGLKIVLISSKQKLVTSLKKVPFIELLRNER